MVLSGSRTPSLTAEHAVISESPASVKDGVAMPTASRGAVRVTVDSLDKRRTPMGAWVALRRGGTPVSHTGVHERVTRQTPVLPLRREPDSMPAASVASTSASPRAVPIAPLMPLSPAVARSAEGALRTALAGDPDLAQVRVGLAAILREDGRVAEAEQELVRALESVPTFHDAARALAELRVDLGRPSDAMQALVRPLRSNPRDADLLVALAEALLALGREEQALSAISRGAAVAPDHAGVRTLQGFLALRAGRDAEALQHWRVAAEASGDDRWSARARTALAEHDSSSVPQTPVSMDTVRYVSG
jgi:Tfp pilus assembly protein PilF